MRLKNSMIKKCLKCQNEFIAKSNGQLYCGSKRLKTGCSFAVYKEKYKIYLENNQERLREYRKSNRNRIKLNHKQWRVENKNKLNGYYIKGKEKILKRQKIYIIENKEKIAQYSKEYRLKNKDRIKKYKIKWANEHREHRNEYLRNRKKTDINFRILHNLRNRLREVLRGKRKSNKTIHLLGCSMDELKIYLENKFIDGMSWENYGKWHIDHIKPCSSFDLSKQEEQQKCFHYTNLQPLWAIDNIRKSNKKE